MFSLTLPQNFRYLIRPTWGHQGVQGGLFGDWFDQKSHFSAIWPSWMVFNPFIWTTDQLLMLGYAVTDLTNQFSVLDIAHRRSPRFHRGLFSGRFDQKSQYPAIWSSRMVLNPFIWTADQLLMLGEVPTDLKNTVYYIQNGPQGLSRALVRLILGKIWIWSRGGHQGFTGPF